MKNIIITFISLLLFIDFANAQMKDKSINVTELTVAKIHKAYPKRQYTSEQLVDAYLKRIKQFDKKLTQ